MTLVTGFACAVASWTIAVVLHEYCHLLVARLVGWRGRATIGFAPLSSMGSCAAVIRLPGLSEGVHLVRHAGWTGSIVAALIATYMKVGALVILPFWWVAVGAVASDLIGLLDVSLQGEVAFACGNFGVLILHATARSAVFRTLRKMLRITMVRGAQSAGLVTYERSGGLRCRVVNGKRTELSDLLLNKLERAIPGGSRGPAYPLPGESWRLFQVCAPSAHCTDANLHRV